MRPLGFAHGFRGWKKFSAFGRTAERVRDRGV